MNATNYRARIKATFYIAAAFPRIAEARALAATINRKSCHAVETTSRWISRKNTPELTEYGATHENASEDIEDVKRAHFMVQLTGDEAGKETRGGRHTELGLALARGYRIFLFGPREQVFHHHSSVVACDSVEQLVSFIDFAVPYIVGASASASSVSEE